MVTYFDLSCILLRDPLHVEWIAVGAPLLANNYLPSEVGKPHERSPTTDRTSWTLNLPCFWPSLLPLAKDNL